jgi:hypothetical protein
MQAAQQVLLRLCGVPHKRGLCGKGPPLPFCLALMCAQRGRTQLEDDTQTREGGRGGAAPKGSGGPPPLCAMYHAGACLNLAGGTRLLCEWGDTYTRSVCEHNPGAVRGVQPLHTPPFLCHVCAILHAGWCMQGWHAKGWVCKGRAPHGAQRHTSPRIALYRLRQKKVHRFM